MPSQYEIAQGRVYPTCLDCGMDDNLGLMRCDVCQQLADLKKETP